MISLDFNPEDMDPVAYAEGEHEEPQTQSLESILLNISSDHFPEIDFNMDNLDEYINEAKEIIRDYDIRGKYESLSDQSSSIIALHAALGISLKAEGYSEIIIGRDHRHAGPELVDCFSDLFRDMGFIVRPIDKNITINLFKHITSHTDNKNTVGLYVTASHNPAVYNGTKIFSSDKYDLSPKEIGLEENLDNLEDHLNDKFSLCGQIPEKYDIEYLRDNYIEYFSECISNLIEPTPRIIFLDNMGGTGGLFEKALEWFKGTNVHASNSIDDPNFRVYGSPNPTKENFEKYEKSLDLTISNFKEETSFVLAMKDGDGDRVLFGVNTSDGIKLLQMGEATLLVADALKDKMIELGRDKIIMTVDASQTVIDKLEVMGFEVELTKVGRTNLIPKINDLGAENVFLAMEYSMHTVAPFLGLNYDDPLPFYMLLANLPNLEELVTSLPEINKETLRLDCDTPEDVVNALEEIAINQNGEIIDIDGIRANFDTLLIDNTKIENCCILARPSSTEPKIMFAIEAQNSDDLRILKEYVATKLMKST